MQEDAIGLDIGSSALKLVFLRSRKGTGELVAHVTVANPIGKMLPDTPEERVRMVTAIQSLFRPLRLFTLRKVRVGLSESVVFTRIMQSPALTDSELSSAIRWEAEQHIPIPLSEVYLDYTVLTRPEKGVKEGQMEILLVAAKQSIVSKLVDLVESTQLELVAIDTCLLSAVRALSAPHDPPTLVFHSGATSTDFAVVSDGRIALTHSISTAGASFTRAIESELSLPTAQAEQYKQAYGLKPKVLDGKVRNALTGLIRTVLSEAKHSTAAFESAHRGKRVQRVILSGGSALLPGLPKEVAKELGVSEVILGNPFSSLSVRTGLTFPQSPTIYSVAVGLGKRERSQ